MLIQAERCDELLVRSLTYGEEEAKVRASDVETAKIRQFFYFWFFPKRRRFIEWLQKNANIMGRYGIILACAFSAKANTLQQSAVSKRYRIANSGSQLHETSEIIMQFCCRQTTCALWSGKSATISAWYTTLCSNTLLHITSYRQQLIWIRVQQWPIWP